MFTLFNRAMRLLTSRQRRHVGFILVASALASAIQTVSILSLMPFIVLLTNPELHQTNSLVERIYEFVGADSYQQFLAIFGAFAIAMLTLGNIFVACEQWLSVRFLHLLGHDIQKKLLAKILRKPYAYVAANSSATLSDVVLNQVERVTDGVIGTFIAIFSSMALAALIVVALLMISLKTTLLSLAGLLVAYAAVFLLLRRRIETDGEESTHLSAAVFASVRESLDGVREIQTRRAGPWFVRRFEAFNLRKSKLAIHHSMMEFLPHYLMETAVFAGFVGVALYFLYTTADAGISLSYIALYGMAVYRLVPALKGIFEGLSTLHHNADAVRVVIEHAEDAAPIEESREIAPATRAISLRNVTYRYPQAEHNQVTDIDLAIPVGSSICLFGPSGSGKTTLLNLLAGLLSPDRGHVLSDDTVVEATTLDSWRKQIGYAPQHAYLFADSLAANIAFGVDQQLVDQQRVAQVGQLANLTEFVSELPHRYATVIVERGDSLSGGQRQRIGVARALYHDPQIVILDESFANLDAANRATILDNLFMLTGRTLIFSSHEPAVVSRCEQIAVIEQGRIVALGSFPELMKGSPRFVELLSLLNVATGQT